MILQGKSIRPFIGAKNYTNSRSFYLDLGFSELVITKKMSYFYLDKFGFYLQDAYVKDWIDNSMIFYETELLEQALYHIKGLQLTEKYDTVRVSNIVHKKWGNEFFVHDPSGILWHFGNFNPNE